MVGEFMPTHLLGGAHAEQRMLVCWKATTTGGDDFTLRSKYPRKVSPHRASEGRKSGRGRESLQNCVDSNQHLQAPMFYKASSPGTDAYFMHQLNLGVTYCS